MPLLGYQGGVPLDFWDTVQSLFDAVDTLMFYLTAFLATSPFFHGPSPGVRVESAQYLLGLGEHVLDKSCSRTEVFLQALLILPGIFIFNLVL